MFNILFPFLILSSGSLIGCLKNKKYEEIVPITALGIILVLFIFYLFNILKIGLYIIYIITLIIYIIFFINIIKKDKEERDKLLKYLFTPGFIIYISLFIIIFIITNNKEILLWDELRLWGAYPKILYYSSEIQLGSNVQLMDIMQSYTPGMPLFQYFFLKSIGIFKESHLILSYSILAISLLIPITKKITWKKWYLIPIIIIILILLPTIFYNSSHDGLEYYKTLFIEPIISITFAYSIFLTTKNILSDKYKYL